ncbi:glycosyltransferase family 39 protein [Candidatus Pacearchaeota archaeon]|nr:glycosyltransferase family 39 protein [Candidatus Pacearchaeota archaeon]
MEEADKKLEERKNKITGWIKDNRILIAILVFAIIIRLYYFILTKNQPLWWDEADYMAYAKNLAGYNVEWIVTSQHNSIYPFIVAGLFKIGFSEVFIKFLLQLIPSFLVVLMMYFICIKMYDDKRIALISSFLMAMFGEFLFNTMRFHIDVPGLFIGMLAIFVFWQGYEKKERIFGKINPNWTIPLTVFLVLVTYLIRRGHLLFGVFFLAYMAFTKKWKDLIKDKYNWIALFTGSALFLLAEKFIFINKISEVGGLYYHEELPISFFPLNIFSTYFRNITNPSLSILLYLFLIGLVITFYNIMSSFGYIKKLEKEGVRADLFNILTILITLSFFMFILRIPGPGDPRWYFTMLLGTFVAISKSSLLITDFIKKYNKHVSIIILIVLIGYGGYYELKYADFTIKNKASSFEGIRQASLFIKENSNPDDLIISTPITQTSYYSERKVVTPNDWVWNGPAPDTPFESVLEKIKQTPEARYLLVSFSEPNHPLWMKTVQVNQQGQMTAWEIPFMDTKVDFVTGAQDIKQEKTYDGITFRLVNIKQDVFIYEIIRNP